jgi:soluble lytic murein transglycosylase-like protein
MRLVAVILAVALLGMGFSVYRAWQMVGVLERTREAQMETMRHDLISGYYQFLSNVRSSMPSRAERLENFCAKAKAYILREYPRNTLGQDIDRFLIKVFESAETYHVSPWLPIAFAAVESGFTARAVSPVGAKGVFQVMPETAVLILGRDYATDCEFNPLVGVDLWFRYYSSVRNDFEGTSAEVIPWICAAYLSGVGAVKAYKKGVGVEDYMKSLAVFEFGDVEYHHKVLQKFNQFINF